MKRWTDKQIADYYCAQTDEEGAREIARRKWVPLKGKVANQRRTRASNPGRVGHKPTKVAASR